MKEVESRLNSYQVDLNKGLSDLEVNEKISLNQINKRKKVKSKSHLKIIFESFFTLFNVILYILALIIALFQIFHPEGLKELPITKYGFLIVILCNALTSIISQEISKKTIDKMKLIVNPKALILRNSKEVEVNVEDIVLDDIVLLKAGNEVPCDLIILEGEVYVNEAMLTGESKAIFKKRGDVLLSGSFINSGNVKTFAYKVGNDTYISQVENKIHSIKKRKSYLTTNINKIIKILLCFVAPLVLLVAFKMFYIGTTNIDPINGKHFVFTLDIINKCSTTIVGMIPIGMILLTTITLAESIVKLYKQKTMVQELYAIENLSRVDTLCLDKTGTLTTQNYLVKEVYPFKENVNFNNIISNIVNSLNDDNSIKELIFKNYGGINDIIVMNSLKPKTITVNGEIKSVKKMDCYAFMSTFDRYIDENGKSISIYTKGKNFMEEKFKSSSYKPSFNCKKATSSIEKAICSNSEVSYLDNLFHSSTKCYKEIVLSHVKNQEYFENQMDILINDFISYRDLSYKSDNGTFTNKELEQVKKAYMLGLMFIPMVVGANDGDLSILGKKLFMSYYMLSMQGVKFTEKHAQKGLGLSLYGLYPNEYNDEIMYYYAGVYDNFNSKLPHLFYYTVYLMEKYGLVDSEGNYKCKH